MQLKDNGIYSVIDIGTNTCLLLIARVDENITRLYEAQETPRLGKDLYSTGKISADSFQTVSGIINKYIEDSKDYGSENILAFGTSALREAKNNDEFIDFIKKETGIRIKIISGHEEARYSYEGAVFDLEKNKNYAVLDIGGGSTEICYLKNKELKTYSIEIGSVRI